MNSLYRYTRIIYVYTIIYVHMVISFFDLVGKIYHIIMWKVGIRASIKAPSSPLYLSRCMHQSARLQSEHPILKRIPKFLQPYTTGFINAPVSHVTAFIILHEITAIIPLFGFWYVFHKYPGLIPLDLPSWAIERGSKIIDSSMAKFDFSDYSIHDKFSFIKEGAYAFVVVKFLLPVRVMFSLTLMPWFAKWFILPFTKMFRKKPVAAAPPKVDKVKTVTKPRL